MRNDLAELRVTTDEFLRMTHRPLWLLDLENQLITFLEANVLLITGFLVPLYLSPLNFIRINIMLHFIKVIPRPLRRITTHVKRLEYFLALKGSTATSFSLLFVLSIIEHYFVTLSGRSGSWDLHR